MKFLVTIHASEVPFNGTPVSDFEIPVFAATREEAERKAKAAVSRYGQSANRGKQEPRYSMKEAN